MAGLPSMINADRITASLQVAFGSYMHTKSACNGDIYDMENLSSDFYPLLSVRKARSTYEKTLSELRGIYAADKLYYVSDGKLYADGEAVWLSLNDSKKQFCSLGDYIVILPDKKYYNTKDGSFGDIESAYDFGAKTVSFCDGSIYGESAKVNTITAPEGTDFSEYFKVGDAVEISGSDKDDNNKTLIIREIEKNELRFYENSFIKSNNDKSVTIKRTMPDMDFIIENENRLWGCKGNEIYASKPGDIFNWNVFDGLSTDSYAASVGSSGEFTGAVSYLGYPVFFKEDRIYKVYGDKPSNFQIMSSASMGVQRGCGQSLAVAGETLFYLSRTGICAYNGGIPQSIAEPFGEDKYVNAVAGSDGVKYYVSMKNIFDGKYYLFVYDTRKNIWIKEDCTEVSSFAQYGGELYMEVGDDICKTDGGSRDEIRWYAEFADIYESSSYGSRTSPLYLKKGVGKFIIRLELEEGASFTVQIKFDSESEWQTVGDVSPGNKRSVTLPIIPRRADHYRLKLSGKGGCVIYSITRKYYQGSER